MKCAILSVGTELLMGEITDTNAVYLSRQLKELGLDVLYRYTVGDNDARLTEVLELAFNDVDLVITTGGLGPTDDDMTKETVTEFMGDHLVEHKETVDALREIEVERRHQFSQNNFKQTFLPSRAEVFATEAGTAPGFALEKDGKIVICMPGPPREMTNMFEKRVRPYLMQFKEGVIYSRILRLFGMGESRVEYEIHDLIKKQTDPTIATYAKPCECSIRIASKRKTEEEAAEAVDEVVTQIKEIVGEYIFDENDKDLVNVVGEKLIANGISISAAESCTGGMFAEYMTSVPGISEVFERSIVTYTERAKMEELGVKQETIDKDTVVSEDVAREMVEGLYAKTGSDICVSVTGIAGPSGGTPEKPVGLMYVGCRYKGTTVVQEVLTINFSREWNRKYGTMTMLDMINKMLDGREIPTNHRLK